MIAPPNSNQFFLSTKEFIRLASSNQIKNQFIKKTLSAIIPVFGAKKELQAMLNIAASHPRISEIIIVDDGSPVGDYKLVQNLALIIDKTVVVRHIKNTGFSGACNTGIALADSNNDILLLNSDSVLPKASISLLIVHSCIEPLAATIGSISNENGFFSAPFCPEITKKLEYGDDSIIRLMLELSQIAHEEVVSNNGYVLYISRDAIDQVGYLDKSIYGKGYGEESDFCLRARNQGLKNICSFLACGYHRGAGSFGLDKNKLKHVNSRLIRAIHPEYLDLLRNYENSSKLKMLQGKIKNFNVSDLSTIVSVPSPLNYVFD